MSVRNARRPGGKAAPWLWAAALLVGLGVPGRASADGSAEAIDNRCAAASDHAQSLERDGKLREARAELAKCSEPTCPSPIRDECLQRRASVDTALPTIVLAAKDSAGNDIAAVRVIVDGELFAERIEGRPLPIDPGAHHVVFQAPGFVPVQTTWVIMQGEKDRRERVVFPSALALPPPAAARPAPALATRPVSPVAPAPAQAPQFWNSTWFWGAIGAAALVGGAIYLSSGQDNGPSTIHLQMQVPH
jgi:hypothetical protein